MSKRPTTSAPRYLPTHIANYFLWLAECDEVIVSTLVGAFFTRGRADS